MKGGAVRTTYDAEIRVGTKVDTSQMQRLQLQIDKAKTKVLNLEREYDELSKKQIPTDAYEKLVQNIAAAEKQLKELIAEEERLENDGVAIGAPWESVLKKEADARLKIEALTEEIQKLKEAGAAFTLGNPEEMNKAANDVARAKAELRMLVTKQNELNGGTRKLSDEIKNVRKAAQKALDALDRGTNKVFSAVKTRAKAAFSSMRRDTEKTNSLLSMMKSRLQGVALSLLLFNQVSKGFRAVVAGIKEGFQNLVKYSDEYNASVSSLISATTQLKNSIAAAFAPLVSVAIPYLVSFINVLSAAAAKVAEFIAALTGKSVFLRATKQLKDYRKELTGTAAAAKKAAGSLAAFDKLNVIRQEENDAQESGGGTGGGAGAGFEEFPISDEMKKLADKVKAILKKLFDPLKKAWQRVGKKVMEAWKFALTEVWKLIKDVGRDFLTMWNQEATIAMFEDILRIIAHIGYTIGYLARQFRKAWNTNEVGLHIFENIRDILAIIIHNIQVAAAYTALWAQKLDFYPLLDRISAWLNSLKPVAEAVSGILLDFYTKVMLPLGKWVLEKGLPELLQVFIDFNNKVDWERLQSEFAELWRHLEPFAEKIGEGLILFVRDLSDGIADFTESQAFQKCLECLEAFMDWVSAEGVATLMEKVTKGLIVLKLAIEGYKALSAVFDVFDKIKKFIGFFGAGGTAAASAETMETVGGSLGKLATGLGLLAVAVSAIALDQLCDHLVEIAEATGRNTTQAEILEKRYDGFRGKLTALSDGFEMIKNGITGYGFAADTVTGQGVALEKAMDDIASGAIYTDEKMNGLQQRFSLTGEDMDMLRQSMLDTNPILREMADAFELYDATPETLRDIALGMGEIASAGEVLPETLRGMTEEAQEFFSQKTIDGMDYYIQKLQEIGTEATNVDPKMQAASDAIERTSVRMRIAGDESIKSFADSLLKGTDEMKNAGDETSRAFLDSLKNGTADITKLTHDFGADAVDGFNIGLTEQAGTTNDAAAEWMEGTKDAIHDSAMRFGSPSKTAEEFGKDTLLGYNQGITRNTQSTVTVIKNWMQTIETTFRGIVDIMADIGKDSVTALIDGLLSRQEELQKKVEELAEKSKSVSAAAGNSSGGGKNKTQSVSCMSLPKLTSAAMVCGGNPGKVSARGVSAVTTGLSSAGVKKAVSEAIRENAGCLGGDVRLTAELDGREVYRSVVKRDRIFHKSTGHSAFEGV